MHVIEASDLERSQLAWTCRNVDDVEGEFSVQTPSQAQRALLKAGQVVAGRIMIGVKPLEQQFRLSIEGLAQDSQGKLSGRVSRQVVMRPHQLDSLPGQVRPNVALSIL